MDVSAITGRETEMVHHVCSECDVTATGVLTPSMEVAWEDHMSIHGPDATSQTYLWLVTQLPFDG